VLPAGDAAIGYTAITTQASGKEYPVLQEVVKTVYDAGKGNLDDKSRIGSVYHNLGIVNGILNVEAVRIAQKKFGNRTLTGDEVRWGFEHLQLDPARVEALGAKDLFHSINVTWDNHEGEGYVTFQQWDGKKWNVVSDWIAPDWALLRPIIEKSSEAYAAEKGIKVRTAEGTLGKRRQLSTPGQGRCRCGPGQRSSTGFSTMADSPAILEVQGVEAVYSGAIAALHGVEREL